MPYDRLRRREFITLLGGATACPLAARAQGQPIIGYLSAGTERDADRLGSRAGLRQGLRQIGFIEGQNVSIEYRFAENQAERLPELAAELVRRQVAVIVASPNQAAAMR